MKKLALIIGFILFPLTVKSQVNYYADTVVYGSKVTYDVKPSDDILFLYNRLKVYGTNANVRTRNGRKLNDLRMQYIWLDKFSEKRLKRQGLKVLRKTFSKQEIGEMYSYALWVDRNELFSTGETWCRFWVDTDGRVFEVMFISFPNVEPFISFSPDRYYDFEQNIKKYINFQMKKSDDMEQASRYLGSMYMIWPIQSGIQRRLLRLAERYGRDYDYLLK